MNKPQDPIRINDDEYKFDDLPPDAQACIMQIIDLDQQLDATKFRSDQLQMGRGAFVSRLNGTIKEYNDALQATKEGLQSQSAKT